MDSGIKQVMIRSAYVGTRIALGIIFLYASFDKIIHPIEFAIIINNYQILPESLINITAIFLPWLEIVIGLFLILGIYLPGTVLISNLLIIAYTAAMIYNRYRGLDTTCGCFSTNPNEGPIGAIEIGRDIMFLFMGLFLLYWEIIRQGKGHESQ